VILPLEVHDKGWPPVGSERMWAFGRGDDYRGGSGSGPFFASRLHTSAREVRTSHDPGHLLQVRTTVWRPAGCPGRFRSVGRVRRGVDQYGMVALDIAPEYSDLEAAAPSSRRSRTSWDWGCSPIPGSTAARPSWPSSLMLNFRPKPKARPRKGRAISYFFVSTVWSRGFNSSCERTVRCSSRQAAWPFGP